MGDWAVNDRVDELIGFDLPGKEEREQLLDLYWRKFVRTPPRTSFFSRARDIVTPDMEGDGDPNGSFSQEELAALADRIEGFSAREISKLALAWQAAAYGQTEGCVLTTDMIDAVTDIFVKQHEEKALWYSLEERTLEED